MTYAPYAHADSIADRFLALLGRLKINPPPASSVEDQLLATLRLIEVMKQPGLALGSEPCAKVPRTPARPHYDRRGTGRDLHHVDRAHQRIEQRLLSSAIEKDGKPLSAFNCEQSNSR